MTALLTALQALSVAAALLLLVPCAVLWLELRAARRATPPAPPAPRTEPLTVLVPAHNEARGQAATLRSIRGQLRSGDRLLVVADNCCDDTAGVARREAADVVERHDPARRGKGYALDFGLRHCDAAQHAVIVMVDADCELAPGCLDRLAQALQTSGRPVQGRYLMLAPPGAPLSQRIAQFAWRLKNALRPQGATRLGWPCLLTGSGMAFRRAQLDAVTLASASIVEDMQLGLDLERAGHAPCFEADALITSRFAIGARATAAQRRRWEHGHLATLVHEVPRLLAMALRRRSHALAGLALELAVPPLAALALVLLALTLAAALLAALGAGIAALLLCGLAVALFVAAVASGWQQAGRDLVQAHEWPRLAGFALRKLPLYVEFLGRQRHRGWNRARRDGE
jgi:cellulose synthase/poly-beta-1,6-N-acetylglucosamine synthase-like glycosyltransferase